MYPVINTPSYPLPPHTLSTLSQGKTPTHSVTPLCHYTPSVASPPIHPAGKHLHSTIGNITTPHDIVSAQDSTHPYITILDHYNEYLLIYLLVCMFACSCCIVIGAFMLSREGQFRESTPGVEPEASTASSHPFTG
jgi:hypothetical protein